MTHHYIDIGLNLANAKFAHDWQAVIERGQAAGVEGFILTGTSIDSSTRSRSLARDLPLGSGYFTAGIHPHSASTLTRESIASLRHLLRDPRAVAVGETGLDYFRDLSARVAQKESFRRHVDLACELSMPLFLHERGAHEDLLRVLDTFGTSLPPCVVHCFTGTPDEAREYVNRGFYIGITGWIGQARRNRPLLEAMPLIPLDRIMLETDGPYLTPDRFKTHTPGRNEPSAMPVIAHCAAEAAQQNLDTFVGTIYENTRRFFRLERRAQTVNSA